MEKTDLDRAIADVLDGDGDALPPCVDEDRFSLGNNSAWGVFLVVFAWNGRGEESAGWDGKERSVESGFEIAKLGADRVMDGDEEDAGDEIGQRSGEISGADPSLKVPSTCMSLISGATPGRTCRYPRRVFPCCMSSSTVFRPSRMRSWSCVDMSAMTSARLSRRPRARRFWARKPACRGSDGTDSAQRTVYLMKEQLFLFSGMQSHDGSETGTVTTATALPYIRHAPPVSVLQLVSFPS